MGDWSCTSRAAARWKAHWKAHWKPTEPTEPTRSLDSTYCSKSWQQPRLKPAAEVPNKSRLELICGPTQCSTTEPIQHPHSFRRLHRCTLAISQPRPVCLARPAELAWDYVGRAGSRHDASEAEPMNVPTSASVAVATPDCVTITQRTVPSHRRLVYLVAHATTAVRMSPVKDSNGIAQ